MKLYTFKHSPSPLKVKLALAELAIAYEPMEINLYKGEHQRPAYKEINPLGAVPVLQDGDLRLRESNAILLYLSAKKGHPGWAGDAKREAEAHQWMFFEAASLGRPCGVLWWSEVVAPKLKLQGYSEEDRVEAGEDLDDSLELLDAHLAKRRFMLGDAVTVVDCSLGPILSMLRRTRLGARLTEGGGRPAVARYLQELWSRPSWTVAEGDAIQNQ
jgi:glutathione S-transferase